MARVFPELFQDRDPEPGPQEARCLTPIFIPKDLVIRSEHVDTFRGSFDFSCGLKSPRVHAPGAEGDHAELLVE